MIGIFDSGIGGLTTARAIMDTLPGYDITYFGDTARTPYGTKSHDTVIGYALENAEFLTNKGARIIIMACNTASSVATEKITEKYNLPIFEVISPAVNFAVETTRNSSIGIIGTRATVKSKIYERKIKKLKPESRVYSKACPLLVPLVEEGWLKKPETSMIIKKYLLPLKTRQIDTLILGCTHYPILKQLIQNKIGKKVTIIDSSIAVANTVQTFLQNNPELDSTLKKNSKFNFFVSDITEQFQKTAQTILQKNILLEHIAI